MVTIKCDPLGNKVYRMDTDHAHMLYLGDKDFNIYINIQIINGKNSLNE